MGLADTRNLSFIKRKGERMRCKNYNRWSILCQECSILDKPKCSIEVKKCKRCNENVDVDRFNDNGSFCMYCEEEMRETFNQ